MGLKIKKKKLLRIVPLHFITHEKYIKRVINLHNLPLKTVVYFHFLSFNMRKHRCLSGESA